MEQLQKQGLPAKSCPSNRKLFDVDIVKKYSL